MFGQGSFINSAATTPEELARKRAEIAAMMPRFGNARYVGEGLGQLFMGIGLGRQQKALDGQEREGRASAQERLNAVFGGGIQGRAQPGGFSVLGTMPMEPVAAPDPASPEGIASDAMAALGRSTYTPGDRESFVKAMMPHALRVSQETGLDPRLVIAQAAQETGWGKSAPNNNYFGIKSHGKGGGGTFATTEFVNGQPVTINDSFRGYGSMGESAADYARFLRENPRYRDMLAAPDLESQIAALGASGYATDPNYANSVASIANSIQVPGMDAAPVGGMNSPQMAAATIPTDALMGIVMDQWQPPEVRAQAQAMLDQQMKMNDPAYTMGLRADELAIQKAQMEIDQMGQPQTPEVVTERRALAAEAGLRQGTPEYQTFMATGELPQGVAKPLSAEERQFWGIPADDTRPYVMGKDGVPEPIGGGGVTVNNNMPAGPEPLGTEGQILVPDPNAPGGVRVEIAQGSKLDMERQAAADKKTSASDAAIIASDVVTTAANRALEAARNRNFGSGGTSLIGNIPIIGGMTDSGEVLRQNKVLGSQATIETLTAMREASPTGGALGSVTEGELQILKDKSGALDPDSPNYERDLADYTLTLLRTIHGKEAGDAVFRETWRGDMPENLDAAPTPPQGLAIGTVEDGWEYIGGDPAQPESWRKVQ